VADHDEPFRFDGIYLHYVCPLCGQPRDPGGSSVIWLAAECIRDGQAITQCGECLRFFRFPAEAFADGILAEWSRLRSEPGDRLHSHVCREYVDKRTQASILRGKWYRTLLRANADGPVDVMSLPLRGDGRCPRCGQRPGRDSIAFDYRCPHCGNGISLSDFSIDKRLGVRVICRRCMEVTFVPPTVWCPKCHGGLLDYREVLWLIADANGIPVERLRV
jgi:rubredoxin